MLSDRQKLILKAIIEEYVDSNEPVGSKILTEKPYLDFSSATIRYDMQDLEEKGYLEKLIPHLVEFHQNLVISTMLKIFVQEMMTL